MSEKRKFVHVDFVEHSREMVVLPIASLAYPVKLCQVILLNVKPADGYSAHGGTPQPAQWVHCWSKTGAAVIFSM